MMTSYPLAWPPNWPRTKYPERSRFETSQYRAQNGIVRELGLLGATNVVISTNIELRCDGLPYTRQTRLDDAGVAVYFQLDGTEQCVPCDKWATIAENMRAIEKTIEALRGLDRWGAKEMVNAAFRGFRALLSGDTDRTTSSSQTWYETLGVTQTASRDEIKTAYRTLAAAHHPDSGGDQTSFEAVTRAYQQGMAS